MEVYLKNTTKIKKNCKKFRRMTHYQKKSHKMK